MNFISSSYSNVLFFLLAIGCLFSCEKSEIIPEVKVVPPVEVVPNKADTCRVIKAIETRSGLSAGTTPMTFEYDSKGRLVKKVYHFEDASQESFITFEYDSTDKLIKKVSIGIPANTYTERYEYNSQARLMKSITQYDTYSVTSVMTYDSEGNRIRMDIENSDGRKTYHTYTYMNGNLKQERYYINGEEYIYEYEYYLDKENTVKVELFPIYNLSATNKHLLKKVYTNTGFADIDFSYEFNEQGLITKVISESTSFATTSVYEYNCY